MSERILITGGAGFIGSHLAASHVASGDDVHILVRPGGPLHRRDVALRGVTVHRVRLDHPIAVARCLGEARPSLIYHLAGGTGRDPIMPSVFSAAPLLQDLTNLLTLLTAAAQMPVPPRRVMRAGSLAEYGNGAVPSREEQREDPLTNYTAAMVAGLHYSRMLQPSLPFLVATARLALVYGEDQSDAYLVPWLIGRCLGGHRSMVSRPQSRRDMIYIDDVIDGLRLMADAPLPPGAVVNLSTGVAPTVREIAQSVVNACGADPALISYQEAAAPDHRVQVLHGAADRAREWLGWRARTDLESGLQLCLALALQRKSA